MDKRAFFRFYAELNDFLPAPKKQKIITYSFYGSPSVKDAIEALGIPHPEVDMILVNGKSVSFTYNIQNNDNISVYPEFELLDISSVSRLRPQPLREPKFIADVNLGKLAKKIRLLGFDTLYSNTCSDKEIIRQAIKEKRIILTKDVGLLKTRTVTHGYWVRSVYANEQTTEVVKKFDLFKLVQPFTRCSVCNGLIHPVAKEEVIAELLERTKRYFNEFYRCAGCAKVYWRGTHYQKIEKFIDSLPL